MESLPLIQGVDSNLSNGVKDNPTINYALDINQDQDFNEIFESQFLPNSRDELHSVKEELTIGKDIDQVIENPFVNNKITECVSSEFFLNNNALKLINSAGFANIIPKCEELELTNTKNNTLSSNISVTSVPIEYNATELKDVDDILSQFNKFNEYTLSEQVKMAGLDEALNTENQVPIPTLNITLNVHHDDNLEELNTKKIKDNILGLQDKEEITESDNSKWIMPSIPQDFEVSEFNQTSQPNQGKISLPIMNNFEKEINSPNNGSPENENENENINVNYAYTADDAKASNLNESFNGNAHAINKFKPQPVILPEHQRDNTFDVEDFTANLEFNDDELISPNYNDVALTSSFTHKINQNPYQDVKTSNTNQNTISERFNDPNWDNGLHKQIFWMLSQNIQKADIQINPKELGPINIQLSLDKHEASVIFTSAHIQVREAVQESIAKLVEVFEKEGLQLINVNINDEKSYKQNNQSDTAMSINNSPLEDLKPVSISENTKIILQGLVDYYV